jgi:hypothetical protein
MEEKIIVRYQVRCYDEFRQRWTNTRWKMTKEEAAKHFADTQYEILPHTRTVVRVHETRRPDFQRAAKKDLITA